MFIQQYNITVFITAETWKQTRCPSVGEWSG